MSAQTSDSTTTSSAPKTTQTLFGKVKPKINKLGLYVAPEYQYFNAANTYSSARGISGMFLINERLALGASGYHVQNFTPKALNNDALRMQYSYGGGKIEYTIAPHRLVHFSIPVLIGAGMARVDSLGSFGRFNDWNDGGRRGRGNNGNQNPFFLVQPGVRVEANLFRFAKLYVGADYRLVAGSSSVSYPSGTTTANLSNSQLSGLSFSAGLKLGLFDYTLKKKERS